MARASINFALFILLSFLTRGARFFFIAVLLKRYGKPINGLLENYFGWFLVILALAVVAGFWLAARWRCRCGGATSRRRGSGPPRHSPARRRSADGRRCQPSRAPCSSRRRKPD